MVQQEMNISKNKAFEYIFNSVSNDNKQVYIKNSLIEEESKEEYLDSSNQRASEIYEEGLNSSQSSRYHIEKTE